MVPSSFVDPPAARVKGLGEGRERGSEEVGWRRGRRRRRRRRKRKRKRKVEEEEKAEDEAEEEEEN